MTGFFGPKTIRQYLHFVSAISNYLGLLNSTEKNQIHRPTKLKSVVSVAYLTIFVSFFVYHLKLTSSKLSGDGGDYILNLYADVSGSLVTSFIIFSGFLRSESTCHMANRLLEIDEKYFTSNTKAVNSLSFKFVVINLWVFSSSVVFDYCYFSFDSVFSIVSIYIFLFYTLITLSQISILLFWLKKSIIKFRKALSTYVPVKTENKRLLVNPIFDMNHQIVIEGNTNLDIVQNLRFLYHDLYLLSQEINDVFATRILLIVGHNFALGTIYMYWGIKQLNKNDEGTVRAICYFKWALASFVSISGLIWPCRTVCKECKSTAITIQELQTLTKDSSIKHELESFSVQLIHEKMEFSPHQFFQLRNELLLSILGAVASYLVILSQFKI